MDLQAISQRAGDHVNCHDQHQCLVPVQPQQGRIFTHLHMAICDRCFANFQLLIALGNSMLHKR